VKSSKRSSAHIPLFLLAAALALVGPRLIRGYGALQWVRHYELMPPEAARPVERASKMGRYVFVAVRSTAPFFPAGEASRLALDVGRGFEARRPGAALRVYADVREAIEGLHPQWLRAWGLTGLAVEARSLQEALERRLAAGGVKAP